MIRPRGRSACYDPTVAPYRDGEVVHVHDYATIRALLRDALRVTADVTEMVSAATATGSTR